ncbi:hypothetical protein L484_000296 [Morus notabilis]|uniref:Uncharacterized protein n=1 Tax=Morus notabilis TaxID=981085 RepID=W9SE79_9ROSA|nr:hypothetical protein L484_000296 [Morus notabilis]
MVSRFYDFYCKILNPPLKVVVGMTHRFSQRTTGHWEKWGLTPYLRFPGSPHQIMQPLPAKPLSQ